MAATREARKREMIANLENDAYTKALVDEAYATITTGSTTNTVAQKKASLARNRDSRITPRACFVKAKTVARESRAEQQ